MKKNIVAARLVLLCYNLQTAVLPHAAFGNIMPNLMIILVAAYGFMNGEVSGLLMGFFCGLLADIFNMTVIGLYALLYMTTGYIHGMFQRLFYPEDIKLPLVLILGSDIGLNFVSYCLLFLLRNRLELGYYALHIILPEAVYTLVVAFAVYPLLLLIHKKLEASERKDDE